MKRRGDSSTSSIEIAVDHSGADTVVRLNGRVDVDSSPDVRDRLRAILLDQSTTSRGLRGFSWCHINRSVGDCDIDRGS
jgi:hypothetical protein